MIEQLKLILKEALIDERQLTNQEISLLQYETPTKEMISLDEKLLTNEQIQLLNIFLHPVKQIYNAEQRFWKTIVEDNKIVGQIPAEAQYYQFIHFHIDGLLLDELEFEEVIMNHFINETTIIWNSKNDGFIVEYINNEESENVGESILEAIMSDFYIKVSIFQGSSFSIIDEANEIYWWEQKAFSLARRLLPRLELVKKEDLIPFLLTSDISEITKKMLLQTIDFIKNDKELLKTIKIFFECNLNTTLAAKKLFMHRNSLQYRIEKFIEKTGIDIKQFQQAAAIYMLLALDESTNKH